MSENEELKTLSSQIVAETILTKRLHEDEGSQEELKGSGSVLEVA